MEVLYCAAYILHPASHFITHLFVTSAFNRASLDNKSQSLDLVMAAVVKCGKNVGQEPVSADRKFSPWLNLVYDSRAVIHVWKV
jgi:predicted ribonuclease YlaK